MTSTSLPDGPPLTRTVLSHRRFILLLTALVLAAILRSAIATRLDDFSMDEAYHIVAGVSYVQRGDFRINPEHPPLVKLWVGTITSALGFQLSPFREMHDKFDERAFVNDDAYYHNDPDALQRHARVAMLTFNGVLLFALGLALYDVFGPFASLGTMLFLAIDPTVAGHLPQVMTDLPVSLLGAITFVLAARAFHRWRISDVLLTSLALGLTLATKHSGPVFCIILGIGGTACAVFVPLAKSSDSRIKRLLLVAAMLAGSVTILWGFYRFRYTESSVPQEVFNRPFADKVSDLHSPVLRLALTHLAQAHLLPRAYLWGLADVARGGLEGRIDSRLVLGRLFWGNGPFYTFPAVIAAKLPIGLSLLALAGIFLFLARRLPAEWTIPGRFLLLALLVFLMVLIRGATYGGMRHALPEAVLLSLFAGFAVHFAVTTTLKLSKVLVALAFVTAAVSALPVLRPYEYYNELVGGTSQAYLWFNDEGIDIDMREKELAAYYHQVLEPAGELPLLQYLVFEQEQKYLKLDWIGRDPKRDARFFENKMFTGTIFVEARHVGPRLYGDLASFRAAQPVKRFGNALVYRGTFDISPLLAADRYYEGLNQLNVLRDLAAAEKMFRRSAELDPTSFWTFIELGDLYLTRGDRAQAIRAFQDALAHAPANTVFSRELEEELQLLVTKPIEEVPALRDPALE